MRVSENKSHAPATIVHMARSDKCPLPKFGEWLLYLFLGRSECVKIAGGLAKDYREAKLKFGQKPATIEFYVQVGRLHEDL